MKKRSNFLIATMFVIGVMLSGCSSPSEKVENASDKVDKANQNLDQAQQDYAADIEKYRKDEAEKFAANEKIEADFNARIANEKKDAREDYQKKMAALDQKSTDLKKRMADYKMEGKDGWVKFKDGFDHDMDALGQDWKDLTTKKSN
jgi:outer membrane murein-binding lipoprotein Lpp